MVDGDTVALRATESGDVLPSTAQVTARLLEVDTPETVKPNSPVECFGPEASEFTKRLLAPGTRVLVAPDEERRDRFGRYLLYVWTADGKFVNEELVRTGHARTALYPPNDRYIERLRAVEREAKAAKRGLWGACNDEEPTAAAPPTRTTPKATETAQVRRYENCDAVRRAGKDPIRRGDPGFGGHLDRDGDGVACEPSNRDAGSVARKPKPQPKQTTTPKPSGKSTYYENCTAVRKAGADPIKKGQPGYGRHLDRDNDGVACDT